MRDALAVGVENSLASFAPENGLMMYMRHGRAGIIGMLCEPASSLQSRFTFEGWCIWPPRPALNSRVREMAICTGSRRSEARIM